MTRGECQKLLRGDVDRVQFSIFRCVLSMRDRKKLRSQLEKILTAEDSLLLAGMCDRCVSRMISCNRTEVWTSSCDHHRIF